MFERILVAFDGTEPSRRALYAGIDLAKRLGRPLRTITVLEDNPIYLSAAGSAPEVMHGIREAADAYAFELQAETAALAKDAGVKITFEAISGQEVDGIVEAVQRHNIDLLIVGIRAHPGLLDRLVSHTTRDLNERSPCSILGVK